MQTERIAMPYKQLASNSKYLSEVLNCACRQNIVGVALFVFVKTCNYAILLLNIGSSWTKSVLYSVFYDVYNLWEAIRNMFP